MSTATPFTTARALEQDFLARDAPGYFTKSIATMSDDGDTIVFRRPGSSTNYIEFIKRRGFLFVVGDLGDAIYQWSARLTWDFLEDCDTHYFAGKCVASEVGRDFVEWDAGIARVRVLGMVDENYEGARRAAIGEVPHWDFQQEMAQWLFDQNIEEMYEAGEHVHIRCLLHWYGLRAAVAQMVARGLGATEVQP